MDDPWGSPWASAASDSAPKNVNGALPLPSPPKSLLSPPPRAFFGGNTTQPGQSHSPWADDGFGEWETSNHAQIDDTATTAAWGSWADSSLTPRAESPGKQSPIAWPNSAATSPGLRTSLRSRSSSVFRQHSPDPWAAEPSWNDNHKALFDVPKQTDANHVDNHIPPPAEVVIHIQQPNAISEELADNQGPTKAEGQDEKKNFEVDATCEDSVLANNLTVEAEGHESPSRPSSTFSVESNHGLDRQDSPITSIDEEASVRPRSATRKVSNKISELVGLYDGLAKAAAEEPPLSERSGSRTISQDKSTTRSISAHDDAETDTNDQKYVTDQVSAEVDKSRTSLSSNRSITPKVNAEHIVTRDTVEGGYETSAPVLNAALIPVQQLIEKYGVIKFEPDVTLLEKALAKITDQDRVESHFQDTAVSDRIITDSFRNIDERKAWYRISRFGSMRKHNSGDEDNYHGVVWQSSQLRMDVIKIVRRWMEEDSFSGKPTLGGSKRTSAFNWDSAVAPVGLDKIFARRSLAARPKTNSVAPLGHTPNSSIGSLGSFLEDRKSFQGTDVSYASSGPPTAVASPIASFGWSTNLRPVSTLTISSSGSNAIEAKAVNQKVAAHPMSPISPPLSAVPPVRPLTFGTKPEEHDDDDDDDDDDEWGEMVFSPTEKTFPVKDDSLIRQNSTSLLSNSEPDGPEPQPFPKENLPVFEEFHTGLGIQDINPKEQAVSLGRNEYQDKHSTLVSSVKVDEPQVAPPIFSSHIQTDPWASADFSFFDTPTTNSTPMAARSNTIDLPISDPTTLTRGPQKLHSIDTNAENQNMEVTLGPIESSDDRATAEIVQRILQNLPDLTYMLR